MPLTASTLCIAFSGSRCLAQGPLLDVARSVKRALDKDSAQSVLIFDAGTSEPVELDLRGSESAALDRLYTLIAAAERPAEPSPEEIRKTPGRPKLGVTAREVTLLPRHWDWLSAQPGGASVSLRRLVEQALRSAHEADQARIARDATYRFIHALAGNEAGFEEASRALFASDLAAFAAIIAAWPEDVRAHALRLISPVLAPPNPSAVTTAPSELEK